MIGKTWVVCKTWIKARDQKKIPSPTYIISGLVCQQQVSRAGTNIYISQWDMITYPCPGYLLVTHKSWVMTITRHSVEQAHMQSLKNWKLQQKFLGYQSLCFEIYRHTPCSLCALVMSCGGAPPDNKCIPSDQRWLDIESTLSEQIGDWSDSLCYQGVW